MGIRTKVPTQCTAVETYHLVPTDVRRDPEFVMYEFAVGQTHEGQIVVPSLTLVRRLLRFRELRLRRLIRLLPPAPASKYRP